MKNIYSVYIVSSILISIIFISGSMIDYNLDAATIVAPDAPADLNADIDFESVYLTWEPPANDGGDPIINYNVYRGSTVEDIALLSEVGDGTDYTDNDVYEGETYYYQVSAENTYEEGARSDEISVNIEPPVETLYSLSGYVKDQDTQGNIPDAYINIWDMNSHDNYNSNTDNAGYFSFNLPTGTYDVTTGAPGYVESTKTLEVTGDRSDLNFYLTSEGGADIVPDGGSGDNFNNDYYNNNDPGSDGNNDGPDSGDDGDGDGEGGGFDGLPGDIEGQLQTVLMVSLFFIIVLLASLITTAVACIAIFVRLGKIKKGLNTLQEANDQQDQRQYRDDHYQRDPHYDRGPAQQPDPNYNRPPPPPPQR